MVTPIKPTLETKLLARELSNPAVRAHSHRNLYSDRRLITNLDVVNELQGHSGCVNALSWSKSGKLLASGSDDQHINIHTYQPDSSDEQFRFSATVATGHTQNIFSVKFMPHSDDRTVVSAAGDGEVRVFDLEYSGASVTASNASARASQRRRGRRSGLYANMRYLTDGDTNSRVYRSHGDRVKRIVTESSPHLFLTCSEDGEVRQWDLRQPSSAYPDPRDSDDVPPPLISYKRYHLDLNSISCSASQPHYIALGGAHLHAFLHDRRMSGRDLARERGSKLLLKTEGNDEAMASATRCVRKFAPKGQQKMQRTQSGHITALKISDARPDEMVASWSGDSIYAFDLVRDPDASEKQAKQGAKESGGARVRPTDVGRKRKRKTGDGSSGSLGEDATTRAASAPRTESPSQASDAALRIRYQNGQSEDVPLLSQPALTNLQQRARQIARNTTYISQTLSSTSHYDSQTPFDAFLNRCRTLLQEMDTTMRLWRYPIAPTPETIRKQQTLRAGRCSARRFVQATGTLSRVLGGGLAASTELDLQPFARVQNKSNDLPLTQKERFAYDFVAAICLWLDSGIGRLIEGFTKLPSDTTATAKLHSRIIPAGEAGPEAIDEILIPHLLELAGDMAVRDPDANKFLSEEALEGQLFASEGYAVRAFGVALRRPFADLSSGVSGAGGVNGGEGTLDRKEAVRFWGGKVARAVLMGVGKNLDQATVEAAFGGKVHEVVGEGGEQGVQSVTALDGAGHEEELDTDTLATAVDALTDDEAIDADSDSSGLPADFFDTSTEDEADLEEQEEDDDSSSDPDDEEDGVPTSSLQRFLYRSAFERNRHKSRVHPHIPCSGPLRSYSGHLNVRTVKDVTYFGLNDEYVVSGSDDGNVFIWDAETTELVNILEGDGEVVNVVQGHPYESLMAVSGIDHTVKIFSPDGRAREDARLGRRGVGRADEGEFSSLAWPHRARMRRTTTARAGGVTSEPAVPRTHHDNDNNDRNDRDDDNEYDDNYVATNGLRSRKKMHEQYQILAKNNSSRDRGDDDEDEGGFGGGRAFLSVRDVQPLLMLLGARLDLD